MFFILDGTAHRYGSTNLKPPYSKQAPWLKHRVMLKSHKHWVHWWSQSSSWVTLLGMGPVHLVCSYKCLFLCRNKSCDTGAHRSDNATYLYHTQQNWGSHYLCHKLQTLENGTYCYYHTYHCSMWCHRKALHDLSTSMFHFYTLILDNENQMSMSNGHHCIGIH